MLSDSPAQQLIGAVFNRRWRLTRLLGEGGMGAVYEAQGLSGEGVRAVKVLHPEFVDEEHVLQRFFAEAQAAQSLQHPNVAQIFEQNRAEDGTPYLVMELLQGMPLSSLAKPGQPTPAGVVVPLILAVLSALSAAHQRGVVHRDLKPDNIFVVADGRGGQTAKVLDFGIAKVMDAAGGMGSKTKTGILLGTPGYMSPEQIKNAKGVDARSDLWSVGIILYEMLSGQEVFPADNEFTRLTMVLTQEVRPIAQVAPQLAAFGPFFQRALSKEPSTRFQSADEMARALAALVPAQAAPPAGAPRAASHMGTVALNLADAPPQTAQPQPFGAAPSQVSPQARAAANAATTALPASAFLPPQGVQAPTHPPPAALSQPPPAGPGFDGGAYAHRAPSTHVSGASAMPNPSTLSSGSGPSVPVLSPPPAGLPIWVVGAVGVACLIVGFLAGYLAH